MKRFQNSKVVLWAFRLIGIFLVLLASEAADAQTTILNVNDVFVTPAGTLNSSLTGGTVSILIFNKSACSPLISLFRGGGQIPPVPNPEMGTEVSPSVSTMLNTNRSVVDLSLPFASGPVYYFAMWTCGSTSYVSPPVPFMPPIAPTVAPPIVPIVAPAPIQLPPTQINTTFAAAAGTAISTVQVTSSVPGINCLSSYNSVGGVSLSGTCSLSLQGAQAGSPVTLTALATSSSPNVSISWFIVPIPIPPAPPLPAAPVICDMGTSCTITAPQAGVRYDVWITAIAPCFPLTELVALRSISSLAVDLTWYSPGGAAPFTVMRSESAAGPFSPVGSTSSNWFQDATASASAHYYYYIQSSCLGVSAVVLAIEDPNEVAFRPFDCNEKCLVFIPQFMSYWYLQRCATKVRSNGAYADPREDCGTLPSYWIPPVNGKCESFGVVSGMEQQKNPPKNITPPIVSLSKDNGPFVMSPTTSRCLTSTEPTIPGGPEPLLKQPWVKCGLPGNIPEAKPGCWCYGYQWKPNADLNWCASKPVWISDSPQLYNQCNDWTVKVNVPKEKCLFVPEKTNEFLMSDPWLYDKIAKTWKKDENPVYFTRCSWSYSVP